MPNAVWPGHPDGSIAEDEQIEFVEGCCDASSLILIYSFLEVTS